MTGLSKQVIIDYKYQQIEYNKRLPANGGNYYIRITSKSHSPEVSIVLEEAEVRQILKDLEKTISL